MHRRPAGGVATLEQIDLTDGRLVELGEGELPAFGPEGNLAWGENLRTPGEARLVAGEEFGNRDHVARLDAPAPPEFLPVADELLWVPEGLIFASRWAGDLFGIALPAQTPASVAADTANDVTYTGLAVTDQNRLAAVRMQGTSPPLRPTLGTFEYRLSSQEFEISDFQPIADLTGLPDGGLDSDPALVVVSASPLDVQRDDEGWRWVSAQAGVWFVSDGMRTWVVRDDGSAELYSAEIAPMWVNPRTSAGS